MGSATGYRGGGLGKAFLGACLERAVQAGVTRVELKAREDNLRALAL
jgi:ribosomal protein S18 acetylase RimI-like enzyme